MADERKGFLGRLFGGKRDAEAPPVAPEAEKPLAAPEAEKPVELPTPGSSLRPAGEPPPRAGWPYPGSAERPDLPGPESQPPAPQPAPPQPGVPGPEPAPPGPDAAVLPTLAEPEAKKGFWARTWEALNKPVFTIEAEPLAEALAATRKGLVQRVRQITRGRKLDEDLLEELEEILLEADVGVTVADGAIAHLRQLAKQGELAPEGVSDALEAYLAGQLGEPASLQLAPGQLNIVLMVGVNGVGKTTTLGKLAKRWQFEGHRPLIAAADTFRAAAIDQLVVWAERAGVSVVRHAEGGDAAAVVFDGIQAARARNCDVLLVDTAGRLHNKANLMAELAKIRRIIDREAPDAPVEALLVLDATTGQNGLRQAEVFSEAVKLTGVVLTKLDGTAKGGVVFGIRKALGTPVKLIGVGEKVDDLKDFDPRTFVQALFEAEEGTTPGTPAA